MIRRVSIVIFILVAAAVLGWKYFLGPDPAEILAAIEVPPSPELSAEAALSAFATAPGFRVEMVASEPMVVDPVAMDWDDEGRLYVVEMRGFMPDIDGRGESEPVGRVVVLEDLDGDGRMDRSDVFLDGLVMPRAVAVLPEGVLVGEPPHLWLCRDTDGDRRCDVRERLGDYGAGDGNPEHKENGLLAGLDGWIYNAKSNRRFLLAGARLEVARTIDRGQWGIDQDDSGRLYYNHNSAFLFGDVVVAEYSMRQPRSAVERAMPGINIPMSSGEKVFGTRVAPGLNRAYLAGTLRADGRQRGPTGVSGLAIQRGDQYGEEYRGHAFVPEAAGAVVAHFAVEREGNSLHGEHRLYDDSTFGKREFLASTDERFRPVDAKVGPDGAIWIIDMYRGVIQHTHFVSEYLREYVEQHGLGEPGATGRIWRIVREDQPIARRPPPLRDLDQQLAALDHTNGWVRDRAQRRIAYESLPSAVEALRRLDDFGTLGRRHALWALDRMEALDLATWRRTLADEDPEIRRIGLRVGESLMADYGADIHEGISPLLEDPDPAVRLQALYSLGSLPLAVRPLQTLLDAGQNGDAFERQAAISGLAGFEDAALEQELRRTRGQDNESNRDWIATLAAAAHLAAQQHASAAKAEARVLDLILSLDESWQFVAMLDGIADAQRLPGTRRVELASRHAIFDPSRATNKDAVAALGRMRRHFTWPGDPRPGGARALTQAEGERFEAGRALFSASCAACHGPHGQGQPGLAPSLVGSPWVRDADAWLVRIALHGLTGPVRIDDVTWDLSMPGHGHDSRFDDEGLSGVLTYLRRAWGHADEPVSPTTVAQIRAQTKSRGLPFTIDELVALTVEHRLDRYVGKYNVPVVGIGLEISREGPRLMVGRGDGPKGEMEEVGDGVFTAPGLMIQFEADASGRVGGASVDYEGTAFPVAKEE